MDAIAVAVGPGSFTGIRIGVSAAKGLAFSVDKPAVGVSTLAAMARNAAFADGLIVCAMDARRSQVYNANFAAESGVLTRLTPDRAISLDDLVQELAGTQTPQLVVGDGAQLCYDALTAAGIPAVLAPPICGCRAPGGWPVRPWRWPRPARRSPPRSLCRFITGCLRRSGNDWNGSRPPRRPIHNK